MLENAHVAAVEPMGPVPGMAPAAPGALAALQHTLATTPDDHARVEAITQLLRAAPGDTAAVLHWLNTHAGIDLARQVGERLAEPEAAVDPLGNPIVLSRVEAHVGRQLASGALSVPITVAQAWDIAANWLDDALGTDHGNAGEVLAAPLTRAMATQLAPDPALVDSFFATTLPRSVGFLLAFIASAGASGAAAGSAAARTTGALLGGASGGVQQFTQATAKGADLDDARGAFAGGAALGVVDALLVGRWLPRLDALSSGTATRLLSEFVATGAEAAIQQFAHTFGDRVIARVMYDDEATLGGSLEQASHAAVPAGLAVMFFHAAAISITAGGRAKVPDVIDTEGVALGDWQPVVPRAPAALAAGDAPIGLLPEAGTSVASRKQTGTPLSEHSFHSTHSDALPGLAQTDARLLSAEDLARHKVERRSGEGEAFSSGGLRQFISVGNGEGGLGTSLAYAELSATSTHYNLQLYRHDELVAEIARFKKVANDFGVLERTLDSATEESVRGRLAQLEVELAVRQTFPPDSPRYLGGPEHVSNFPIMFEFDPAGLARRGSNHGRRTGEPLGDEGRILEPVDLRERLLRVYVPEARRAEGTQRIAELLGHSDFEVRALEDIRATQSSTAPSVQTADQTIQHLGGYESDFQSTVHLYDQEILATQAADALDMPLEQVETISRQVGGVERFGRLVEKAGGLEPFEALVAERGSLDAVIDHLEGPGASHVPMAELHLVDKLAADLGGMNPIWLAGQARSLEGGAAGLAAMIARAGGPQRFRTMLEAVEFDIAKVEQQLVATE